MYHLNWHPTRNALPEVTPLTPATLPSQRINNTEVVLNARLHEFRNIDTSTRLRRLERHTTSSIEVQHPARAIINPSRPCQVTQALCTRRLRSLDESAPDLPEDGSELRWLVGCRRTEVRRHIGSVQSRRDGVLVVIRRAIVACKGGVEPVRRADKRSFGVDIVRTLLGPSCELADIESCYRAETVGCELLQVRVIRRRVGGENGIEIS